MKTLERKGPRCFCFYHILFARDSNFLPPVLITHMCIRWTYSQPIPRHLGGCCMLLTLVFGCISKIIWENSRDLIRSPFSCHLRKTPLSFPPTWLMGPESFPGGVLFACYSQREFPGTGHGRYWPWQVQAPLYKGYLNDAKTMCHSLPLDQRTWKASSPRPLPPPFPISQTFQSIKPQLHSQWASHKSSSMWVPLLTPLPRTRAVV